MYIPPHPGEFIGKIDITSFGVSLRQLAGKLGVSPPTLTRILQERSGVSPEIALRLSKTLGRSPESWLAMQNQYDLWHTRRSVDLDRVGKIEFDAA